MLRELVKIIGLPSCEIADQLHVARSTLSGYLSAYRLPDLKLAVSLYQAAESAAASNGGVMPFTREALEAQYRLAQIKLCAKCPAWEGALPGYDTPASSQGGSLNGPAALAAGFPAPLSSEQTPPELSQAPADLPVLHVGGTGRLRTGGSTKLPANSYSISMLATWTAHACSCTMPAPACLLKRFRNLSGGAGRWGTTKQRTPCSSTQQGG